MDGSLRESLLIPKGSVYKGAYLGHMGPKTRNAPQAGRVGLGVGRFVNAIQQGAGDIVTGGLFINKAYTYQM